MSVPELSIEQLTKELDKRFKDERHRKKPLIALYGRADFERVDSKNVGPIEVRSVASEYELRRALPDLHDRERRMAFLVGWEAAEVPVDLAGRFVRHGRIFRIEKADRLNPVFGGARSLVTVDPDLSKSRLGDLLLAHNATFATDVGRVTLDHAYELWLESAWCLGEKSSLGLDTLLAWAASNEKFNEFRAMMAEPEAAGVDQELRAFLGRRIGDVAPLVWDMWQRGKGRTLFEFAILFEALLESDGAGPVSAIRTASKHSLGLEGKDFERAWRPLGRTVEAALRQLDSRMSAQDVRQLLQNAQSHLDASDQPELASSRRLPIAWRQRLDALGQTLGRAGPEPTLAAVEQAIADLRAIDAHTYAQDEDQIHTLERAQMATRLLAWLAVRTDRRPAAGRHSFAQAEALALWYVQEGGFIDWARQRARGSGSTSFDKGVDKVLAHVDAARIEQDRTFARGLVAWLEEERPSQRMIPIDRAVGELAVPFLESNPNRRLLVILMDGMAWAQSASIMLSLAEGGAPWQPIAWNTKVRADATQLFTPVVASLPSVTHVSRSAFFAGKPMATGSKPSASANDKHWATNKALSKLFPGAATPRLHMRGDGFKGDGHPAPETFTMIEDTSQPVVAVIINAIDETLKADTQAQVPWTANHIPALRAILQAAASAGRAVLMASDHGHVSGQRLTWAGHSSGSGSSRWRPWREDDAVAEYEVGIPLEHAWTPKEPGVKGVICLADDAHSYSNQSHYGEHGGATLAEVLAPTFLIGCENLEGTPGFEDRDLDPRAFPVPDWWNLEVRPTAGQQEAAQVARPKPSAPAKRKQLLEDAGQLTFAQTPAAPAVAPPPAASSSEVHVSSATRDLLSKLQKNPLFKARTEKPGQREETLEALEFLLERSNHAPTGAFASHLQHPKFRVSGLVSKLSEVLNMDGYEVVTLDTTAGQVRLNPENLKLGFGL